MRNIIGTAYVKLRRRGEAQQQINTHLPRAVHQRLKLYAITHNRFMHEVMTEAVERYLEAKS